MVLVGWAAAALLLAGCSRTRAVPVTSECPGEVRATFAGNPGVTWRDPIVIDAEGTSLGVPLDVDRVWFVATDGEVLNEVSLTPEQLADPKVDFPTLVIRSQDCPRLETVS